MKTVQIVGMIGMVLAILIPMVLAHMSESTDRNEDWNRVLESAHYDA